MYQQVKVLTLLRNRHPGGPRSREKDQVILDAVATKLMVAHSCIIVIRAAMVRAPERLPTPCWKTNMNGKSVGVFMALSGLMRQKSRVSNIPNAMAPFRAILKTMARGTFFAWFDISSDI